MKVSMLRVMVVGLFLALSTTQVSGQYSITLPYKQVSVQNGNGTALFDGAFTNGLSGQPALPAYSVSFLLPPGVDFSGVSVSINNTVVKELSDAYEVNPNPPLRHQNGTIEWPKGAVIVNSKDMRVYGKDAFFPADYQGAVSLGKMRQYNTVDIKINPFLYNPVSKKLRMITGGTLVVTVSSKSGSAGVIPNQPRSDWAEKILRTKIVNPEEFNSYGAASTPMNILNATENSAAAAASLSGALYIIVTTQYIIANSTKLAAYINNLQSKGATVQTWSESDFDPGHRATTQMKADNIRQLLINAYYSGSKPGYVLLIGNPDTSQRNETMFDVPMKNSNGIPTDFYYADLNSDWSNTGTDNGAEASVGRIPVYDADGITTLDTYLIKAISYKSASGSSTEWRRFFLSAAGPVGWTPESYTLGEKIISLIKPKGWLYHRLFDPYSNILNFYLFSTLVNRNPLPEDIYCNTTNVANTWNSEAPGLVIWYTHGSGHCANDIITSYFSVPPDPTFQSVALLNNDFPAIVYAASCGTGDPQPSDNLAYMTLRYNAIAYVGASVEITSPDGAAYSFAQNVAVNNLTAGDALVAAKAWESDESHSLMNNLYGCPEVALNLATIGNVAAPTNFTAHAAAKGSPIQLTWNSVANAKNYVIERSSDHVAKAKRVGFSSIATLGGTVTSYSDPSVSYASVYRYRIYSIDASNVRSAYSALDSAATYDSQKGSVPAIPTGFSAKAAFSNGGTFVWAVVSNATSYNVKRSRASVGPFVTIGNTPWAAFTDSNLVNGTTYYYSISAVNQYGQSGNSAAKSFSTSATLGTPVIQGIGMYDEFPQHTSFSWLPMSTNDLMYEIQWAHKMPDNSCDPFKTLYLPGGDQWAVVRNTTWAKDTTSETNTELAFRIRCRTYAKDSTGMAIKDDVSPWSSITYYSNPAISPLDVPTNLAATMSGVGPEKLKVTWTSDDIANLAFEVYYKTNGGVWQLSTLFGALDSIPNLKRNTQYQLCIRAVNNNVFPPLYSKFSNIISATTSANLAAPTNLFASMVARNQISLMWSDNSVSESGYYIERATSKTGSYTQIASVGTDVNTYSNTGLSDGQIFWYRVRAYSGSTYSAYSNLISDTVARNLALSRTPSATSSQGSYPAKNGNDNVTTTRWAASGSVPQTWTVDLGRPSNVITSEVMWEQSGTGKVYKYKVEYSDDNKNWFTMADLSSNTSTAQTQVQNWGYGSYAVTTRYVHISVIGVPSGAFASFYEFRVFGN